MSMTRRDLLALPSEFVPDDNRQTSELGLEAYAGLWDFERAGHLLSRSLFGPTYKMIKDSLEMGLEATVDSLMTVDVEPDPPVNYYFENDPNVPVGQTWVDAPVAQAQGLPGSRRRSMYGWTLGLMINQGMSIREKMVLFWHNHFVVANVNDARYTYRYSALLRRHALGNFRQLTREVTIDPAMLQYLNGSQNTKEAPNENYARELLELFTVGKGDLAGPGDYTTFTEQDVLEIARALTGWVDRNRESYRTGIIEPRFVPSRHDTGDKQLSHRFDNAVITNNGADEYSDVIDIIFQQEAVARYIARKLYRWFVYYTIDENVEQNVIEPLAGIIIEHDFEIAPALRALLSSQHFYDEMYIGAMIKSPYDFLVGAVRQLEVQPPDILAFHYEYWYQIFALGEPQQMVYYFAPNVAGWKPYYQEPGFYQIWINSSTLPARMDYTDQLLGDGLRIARRAFLQPDILPWIQQFDDPLNPNTLIRNMATLFFPRDISDSQLAFLKEALIPGLPDYEWTIEYTDHLANPDDNLLRQSIEAKLKNLLSTCMQMPEFYLA